MQLAEETTSPIGLVTPAKHHDNQYPKPAPVVTSFGQSSYSFKQVKPETLNNVNGVVNLPAGEFIQLNSQTTGKITDIVLTKANFTHPSGLFVLSLSVATEQSNTAIRFCFEKSDQKLPLLVEGNAQVVLAVLETNEHNYAPMLVSYTNVTNASDNNLPSS